MIKPGSADRGVGIDFAALKKCVVKQSGKKMHVTLSRDVLVCELTCTFKERPIYYWLMNPLSLRLVTYKSYSWPCHAIGIQVQRKMLPRNAISRLVGSVSWKDSGSRWHLWQWERSTRHWDSRRNKAHRPQVPRGQKKKEDLSYSPT